MTVTDVPLASATRPVVSTRPGVNAPVNARARVGAATAKVKASVLADLRSWWLLTAEPASLRSWLVGQSPADRRVPAGAPLLRLLWIGHNWSLGLLVTVLGAALHLAGGFLRWLGGHPLRLWSSLILTAVTVTAIIHL